MDATIIANIDDARSRSNFLTSQKQLVDNYYTNYNSYLYNAQQVANGYMSMKQRVPMVLEYYQTPEELYTIEMYINPNELSFSHQKLIGKEITRGGIFFHHYGEDAPTLNISGHTGLAGMAAIEQLERIFNYSGTLLRYQNVGINKINNGAATPREILQYTGTFNFNDNESSGLVADTAKVYDNLIKSNAKQTDIDTSISLIQEELNKRIAALDTPANQIASAQSIVSSMSVLKKTIGYFDTRTDFNTIVVDVTDELEKIQQTEKHQVTFTIADIYDISKKIVKKVTKKDNSLSNNLRESYAFQVAWKVYVNLQSEEIKQNLLKQQKDTYSTVQQNINSTNSQTTLKTQKNTSISDFSKNTYTNLQDNTKYTLDTNKATTRSVPMSDDYTCIVKCNLYEQPNFNSSVKQELSVNGRFSAKCGTTADGNWIEHINGGYAPLKASGYVLLTKDKFETEDAKYLYKEPSYDSEKFSNTPLVPNALFTYTESKAPQGIPWFKHKNGGWAMESAFNTQYSSPQFFKLNYANCYRYTIIRDDVMLYKEPNDNSEKFRDTPCAKGELFTAIELKGNWAHWINGGWIKIMNADGTYNVDGESNDGLAQNDLPKNQIANSDLLTSNNDITLNVQEVVDDCTTELQKYIRDVRIWAKNSVIKRFEIESGLADIIDELTDPWLPRLVFIYFEDRVFLGHFNDFKYSRKAETEDIVYSMAFTIHRIISVTSIDPERFEQNNQLNNVETPGSYVDGYSESLDYLQEQYQQGNDIPLKVEILRTRCKFRIEKMIANYTGVPMTKERQDEIHGHAVRLRSMSIYNGKQQITESTPIYGNTELSYEQFLGFMKIQYKRTYNGFTFPTALNDILNSPEYAQQILELDRKINGDPVTLLILNDSYFIPKYDEIIELELQRTLSIWEKEKINPNIYTKTRKQELVNHATNLLTSIGARFKDNNDYKTLMNHVLYEYNLEHNTNINPYNNNTTSKVTSIINVFDLLQNSMTDYIKYFQNNKAKISNWIQEFLENNQYNIVELTKYVTQKIKEEQAVGLSNTTEEIDEDKTQQISETNGIYYTDFIKNKVIEIKVTSIFNVYDVPDELEILYKTNNITIQIDKVKGNRGFEYTQITIIPNISNTKNDIFVQLYNNNFKVQENRIKIVT